MPYEELESQLNEDRYERETEERIEKEESDE